MASLLEVQLGDGNVRMTPLLLELVRAKGWLSAIRAEDVQRMPVGRGMWVDYVNDPSGPNRTFDWRKSLVGDEFHVSSAPTRGSGLVGADSDRGVR